MRNVRRGCKEVRKKKSAFVKGIQRETNKEGVCLSAYQGLRKGKNNWNQMKKKKLTKKI